MDGPTFWTAVAAIGTLLAPVVALVGIWLAYRKGTANPINRIDVPSTAPLSTARIINLKGQYDSGKGDIWDIEAELPLEETQVTGHVRWRLVKWPPSWLKTKKIGEVGVEWVRGTYKASRLELHGEKVDKPTFKGPGDYLIGIHTNETKFEGSFVAHNVNVKGDVRGDVSIRPLAIAPDAVRKLMA